MMKILLVGVNHKFAPVEVREKITYTDLFNTLQAQLFPQVITEFVIITTCNRTEIYAVTLDTEKAEEMLRKLFQFGTVYVYTNQEAVKHLYKVASGIDSMILGESEILSQVREAYKLGIERHTVALLLHQLFKEALKVGKIARNKTSIGVGIRSIGHGSIQLAQKHLENIEEKNVLVIGAGMMAQKIVKNFLTKGITHITVINRTYQKAVVLTKNIGGKAGRIEDLKKVLEHNDLIITATSAPGFIITSPMIKQTMRQRESRPMCLVDLAVPRNVEQSIAKIKNVYLYNIDDLQNLVDSHFTIRKKEITQVKTIIEEETGRFWIWFNERKTVPFLLALNDHATAIKNAELEKAYNKLMHLHLNDHDKKIIATLATRIENKLLAKPMINLKKAAVQKKGNEYVSMVKELFEL